MNAAEFAKLLNRLGACTEARSWASGKSLELVWASCHRGDWLLWLAARMIGTPGWPSHTEVVLASVASAETALKYVPAGEDRPRLCLETVRLWAGGKATLDDVRKARRAAAAADAADADAADAAYAAYAAYAAAYAAAAAAADAAYAAYAAYAAAARKASQIETANIVRSLLSIPGVRP